MLINDSQLQTHVRTYWQIAQIALHVSNSSQHQTHIRTNRQECPNSTSTHKQSSTVIRTNWLLLLSRFNRVRLCVTPQMAAHQAPSIPGILQARTLEWGAIAFSKTIGKNAQIALSFTNGKVAHLHTIGLT